MLRLSAARAATTIAPEDDLQGLTGSASGLTSSTAGRTRTGCHGVPGATLVAVHGDEQAGAHGHAGHGELRIRLQEPDELGQLKAVRDGVVDGQRATGRQR